MKTYHWPSSPLPCSPFQAPLGTTKIWDLVFWQHDEYAHSFGICFKLSIKISTILGRKISTVRQLAGWGKQEEGTEGGKEPRQPLFPITWVQRKRAGDGVRSAWVLFLAFSAGLWLVTWV